MTNINMTVIEPGTPAYDLLRVAVAENRKVSIDRRGPQRVAIKIGEYSWSPTLQSNNDRTLVEPPANT